MKKKHLHIRISGEDKKIIEELAKKAKLSLSSYCLNKLLGK